MKNNNKNFNNRGSFNRNKRNKHSHNSKSFEEFSRPPEKITIEEINPDSIGDSFIISGTIDRVVETAGPTIFHILDGTGTFSLKGFVSPGARAFPEIEEGDLVTSTIKIEEFRDELEGSITKITKLTGTEKEKFLAHISQIERKRAAVTPPEFLIKSKLLDKFKSDFEKAATEIRLAVIQNRPIIVRHHNDADGYSSGYALEKSIIPLIQKQHGAGKAPWEFFTRAPCSAPFYEIDDSIRDTARSLSNAAKFSNKMPLVIIADNGSSQEDLLGISQGKVHGLDFIVVDHHFFEEDVISDKVLVHINPFLKGEDGAKFSAGMLCTELARFISDVENVNQIPAMAGMADRIDNEDAMSQYIKIAEKQGYSESLLHDISTVIDFVSAKLRFMEAREYIEVIFGEPRSQQKKLVSLLAPYIKKLEAKGLEIAKNAATSEDIGSIFVQYLEIENTFSRGFYPKPGKCVGLLHDSAKKEGRSVVTLGTMPDALTMRATDEAKFSVHDLIAFLHKKIPKAFVEGGGHKNAGSIRFVPSLNKEVMKLVKEYIISLK